MLLAGAAGPPLSHGHAPRLQCVAPGPLAPQAKDRYPIFPLRVQPCLSAPGGRCQGFPGRLWCRSGSRPWPGLPSAGAWAVALMMGILASHRTQAQPASCIPQPASQSSVLLCHFLAFPYLSLSVHPGQILSASAIRQARPGVWGFVTLGKQGYSIK